MRLKKVVLQWLPCQASGDIGSALGLVGPMSVHWDGIGIECLTVTSTSVWQDVQLSEQIRPLATVAWCWDVEQASK